MEPALGERDDRLAVGPAGARPEAAMEPALGERDDISWPAPRHWRSVVNRSWRGFLVVSSDPVTLRGCFCGAGRVFAAAVSLRSVRSACDGWGQRSAAPGTGRAGRGRGGPARGRVPARGVAGRGG